MRRSADGYLPIEHYGVIGNLRSAALVGMDGSIDWCCLPELDDPSVFGALLDTRSGGRFRVAAAGARRSGQRYHERSNVLQTWFETDGGRLTSTDFMPLCGSIVSRHDRPTPPTIHRLVACEAGEVDVEVEWSPRFDYARVAPRMRRVAGGFEAETAGRRLSLVGLPPDVAVIAELGGGPAVHGRIRLRSGERLALVTRYGDGDTPADPESTLSALATTDRAWREWCDTASPPLEAALGGRWQPHLERSALALKLLTYPDTGAIAAAATTSLPEEIGGVRNWDYRFSWIRDAAFTAQALFAMGHRREAVAFLEWVEGICSEKVDRAFGMQIMYGLRGESRLPEIELGHLEGYRGSRPVRIGNGAAVQEQHDIYGELLSAAYELVRLGGSLDARLMTFLSHVARRACDAWRTPDHGIWEVRGGPRHFVYSKLMVWVALDRAVRMSERWGLAGDVARWRSEREAVREAILTQGFDERVGAFVQSFGSTALDAANLLIPVMEFLPANDPRVRATVDRTLELLTTDGLVHRYRTDDGLPGNEGAFGLATFWMVDALALSGRLEEAEELFDGMVARANHVGLYSEEVDVRSGAFLGNFPQAFTHVGLINSALYLARAEGRRVAAPAPLGTPEHRVEAAPRSRP